MTVPSIVANSFGFITSGASPRTISGYSPGAGSNRVLWIAVCGEGGNAVTEHATSVTLDPGGAAIAATLLTPPDGAARLLSVQGTTASSEITWWYVKEADIPAGPFDIQIVHATTRANAIAFTVKDVDQTSFVAHDTQAQNGLTQSISDTTATAVGTNNLLLSAFGGGQGDVDSITGEESVDYLLAATGSSAIVPAPDQNDADVALGIASVTGDGTTMGLGYSMSAAASRMLIYALELTGTAGGGGGSTSRPAALIGGL